MSLESLRGHYGEIPEFVDMHWVSNYIRFSCDWIRKVHLLENIPFKYSGTQTKLYRWTEVKKRLTRYKLLPPDVNHPNHRFSPPEVIALLDVNQRTYFTHVKLGHLTESIDEKGHKFVYNKDLNLFRRNFDMSYLIGQMLEPIRKETARIILNVNKDTFKRLIREGKLTEMPRKKRQRIRYSQETMMRMLAARTTYKYRREAMPDVMSYELAQLYSGMGVHFMKYVRMGVLKADDVPSKKGGTQKGFFKKTIDDFAMRLWTNECYSENRPYYTRKTIKYKFGKCDAWIDKFISGKCTPFSYNSKERSKGHAPFYKGWVKSEVEAVVNSGVEVEPEIFVPKKITHPLPAAIRDEKKFKPKFNVPAADLIENAIEAAFSERDAKREAQVVALRKEHAEKYARRAALQHELNYTTKACEPFTRNALLKLSNEREIITLMYTRNGIRLYQKHKHSPYENVFKCSDNAMFTRRPIMPSIGRIISGAIAKIQAMELRRVPLWVVVVSGTSMVTDINFYEKLRNVPDDVGAVAPFGYEYRLPDGTWDVCNKTYGIYSKYHADRSETEYVIGTSGVNGNHKVQLLDGPFVAFRGEYLQQFRDISKFNRLGDCRGAIGPIMSAICKVYGITMMQIPVESWCASEYDYDHDSMEWKKVEDAILTYEKNNGVVKY